MASLSDICTLPTEWVERAENKERNREIGMSKKLAWKTAKRKEHERKVAMRERAKGESKGMSIEASRRKVARETMPEPVRKESRHEIFYLGKGVRQPKKARNTASSEEMGTIPNRIVVKRFNGSRLTCVCKTKVIY